MENSESNTTSSLGKEAGGTPSGSRPEGVTETEKTLEAVFNLGRQASDKCRAVAENALEAITDNPRIATLSGLAVGLAAGFLLGALLRRD